MVSASGGKRSVAEVHIVALALASQLVLFAVLPAPGAFPQEQIEASVPAYDPGDRPSLGEFINVYGVGFRSGYAQMDTRQSEEHFWLALAVYFEARNQSLEAQMAIAQVVINRKADRRWPPTIRGVVSQGRRSTAASWRSCQFSFMCDGRSEKIYNHDAWKTAREIAFLAITPGGWTDLSGGATHYHSRGIAPPSWTKAMKDAGTAGDHQLWQELN